MLTVGEICAATGGVAVKPYADTVLTDVITDSRLVKARTAFVAIAGEKMDGHDFCAAALQAGAAALVVKKLPDIMPEGAAVIQVDDTLAAYQSIAAYYRNKFKAPVVAVTGSTGKTTTKDLIAAAVSNSKAILKSQGNFNNEIGLPATLLKITDWHQAAVVEMGMRGPGQIRQLARIARPDIGVVTNVGNTHIELLGSMANIAAAKQELIEELGGQGVAVLNGDDPYARAMAKTVKGRTVFFGFAEGLDVQALDVWQYDDSMVFTCRDGLRDTVYQVKMPLLGRHNVYNALCAVAVSALLSVSQEDMLAGLQEPELTGMRQNIRKMAGLLLVDDTYNASPSSMRAALDLLSGLSKGRKVAALGDMLELGEVSDIEHERLGKLAAEAGVDFLVTVGKHSELSSQKARSMGLRTRHFAQGMPAAQALLKFLKEGDTVLFKGSRSMRMEDVLAAVEKGVATQGKEGTCS